VRPFWKKKRSWFVAVLLVLVAGIGLFTPIPSLLVLGPPMGAGAAAELACAGVYVMGRDLDEVAARDLQRLSPLTRITRLTLDREHQTVTASVFGLIRRSAFYRPGAGCTLLLDTDRATLQAQATGLAEPVAPQRPAPWPAGDAVDLAALPPGIDREALEAAVLAAFEDPTPEGHIDTRAVVVAVGGRIVAERYAPGFDPRSRFLGWSACKSVTSALVGTLVTDGKLALDAPAPVAAWRGVQDGREKITLRQLLDMASGLAFAEPYIPGADSTTMLFARGDMAGYAAAKQLAHPPGAAWSYSSGTTNILSRIVFDAAGGTLRDMQHYAQNRLFTPAGMTSFLFEPDATGSYVGSSYCYGTARDWARFAQLYLDGGARDGVQILSPDWVAASRTPVDSAPGRRYGLQFWLNPGNAAKNEPRMLPALPPDTFLAMGHNYQVIAAIPSKKAVVVRLGWTSDSHRFDINRHFAAILAAIHESEPGATQ
jgi:CubicO group peptidase (beta-lactamase class C family)